MEKKYTGSRKELEDSKNKGLSKKAKKYIATALIAGTLISSGSPTYAYNNYSPEELQEHIEEVAKLQKAYDYIEARSQDVLDKAYMDRAIKKDAYDKGYSILNHFLSDMDELATDVRNKPEKIRDKKLIYLKVLEAETGSGKTRVLLNLNDIASLNREQIETLEKTYDIDSITLNRYYETDYGSNIEGQFTYSPETYKKLLYVMGQKFGDLKNNNSLTELEKVIIVLKRMENIEYDNYALNIPNLSDSKAIKSRNMEGPLLNNTAICAGYSDLFKNIMSYLGIEAREIRGEYNLLPLTDYLLPGQPNHAWNQVKINNQWYNLDITAMVNNKEILEPNKKHPYLFTSDGEFNHSRSSRRGFLAPKEKYTPLLGSHEEAKESISEKEIDIALNKAIEYEKKLESSKVKNSSQRSKFLSKLSNNGKYKSLEPHITPHNSIEESKSLNKNNMER